LAQSVHPLVVRRVLAKLPNGTTNPPASPPARTARLPGGLRPGIAKTTLMTRLTLDPLGRASAQSPRQAVPGDQYRIGYQVPNSEMAQGTVTVPSETLAAP